MMKKWKRPKPCWCSGYWFPHRTKSGACVYNPNVMVQVKILGSRLGMTDDEMLDLFIDLAWDNPGIPGIECPF